MIVNNAKINCQLLQFLSFSMFKPFEVPLCQRDAKKPLGTRDSINFKGGIQDKVEAACAIFCSRDAEK